MGLALHQIDVFNRDRAAVAEIDHQDRQADRGLGGGWVINANVAKSITSAIPSNVSNTEALGLVLYTKYIHYFQIAGMVLLVAMIGAIVLTLRHKASVKRQDINVQNARTPELAMAVRKVASGQGLQDVDAAEWVQ